MLVDLSVAGQHSGPDHGINPPVVRQCQGTDPFRLSPKVRLLGTRWLSNVQRSFPRKGKPRPATIMFWQQRWVTRSTQKLPIGSNGIRQRSCARRSPSRDVFVRDQQNVSAAVDCRTPQSARATVRRRYVPAGQVLPGPYRDGEANHNLGRERNGLHSRKGDDD